MSDIPYINRLGDALESAITTTSGEPRRPRRRRVWIYAGLGALVISGSAGAAGLLSGSGEQAANSIACFGAPPASSESVTIVFAVDRSPTETCAAELRRIGVRVPPLVACSDRASVAVIPGRTAADCARHGLRPLVRGFELARAKIARLERDVLRLEAQRDCATPTVLTQDVQAILDRSGWTGWKTRILPPQPGSWQPCGAVSTPSGGAGRTLAGALDPRTRHVLVQPDIPRALGELLYGDEGLAPQLEDHSGSACFEVGQLVAHADRALAPSKLRAHAVNAPPLPDGARLAGFADARQARYEAGCAIVTNVRAGDRAGIIALEVMQQR